MAEPDNGVFLGAFVDELGRLGVTDVVVSPGSRSTPLAMVLDRSEMRVHVDIDERGAAYFALGLAKAAGRSVCLLCTSGTAAANYYPAICEAATARVPLIVLTADRPHILRGLGANQTTDQIKMFGAMVRLFAEMPIYDGSDACITFARQIAREAVLHATGTPSGAVHLNFPFHEPLMPDLSAPDLFSRGRRAAEPAIIRPRAVIDDATIARISALIEGKRTVIVCGEGAYPAETVALARELGLPLLADPLSNLRQYTDAVVIDNYDNIARRSDAPAIEAVIRFGPYPVSKSLFTAIKRANPVSLVIDEAETRDFNHLTDLFVQASPGDFIASALGRLGAGGSGSRAHASAQPRPVDADASGGEHASAPGGWLENWVALNTEEDARIASVTAHDPGSDGAHVSTLLRDIVPGSLLFAANSMAVRYIDTFYRKGNKPLRVMCNRGLSGIDGTLSSALGAALAHDAATLLTGDLSLLHDLNALHLQRGYAGNLTIVVINNNGGGIFEMLPQRSDEPYFERLFLTPHDVDFGPIAAGFGVGHVATGNVEEFAAAYRAAQSQAGIKIVEIRSDISRLARDYRAYV